MKIAILSDIHDNVWNLEKALSKPELQDTKAMLFCGDLCAPFIIKLIGERYTKPVHMVLGNNDGDVASIMANAKKFSNIHIHGEYFRGEIGGKTIGMNHYPDKSRILAEMNAYDVVCYGHNHTLSEEMVGNTLLINPGAIMGFHGGKLQDITPTLLILDSDQMKTEVISIR